MRCIVLVMPFASATSPHRLIQAMELRRHVDDLMQKHGDPLFVVSPLSRAMETFLHMLPCPDRLGGNDLAAGQDDQGPRAAAAAVGGRSPAGGRSHRHPLNIVVNP